MPGRDTIYCVPTGHYQGEQNEQRFSQHCRLVRERVVTDSRSCKEDEGKSIYFYDYDNHLFELHSGNLEDRLRYYKDHDMQIKD